jgi:hypothetical protein
MKSNNRWTTPYFGVSHYGEMSSENRWATITRLGNKTIILICWNADKAHTFNSPEFTFTSIIAAQQAGEAFVENNTIPEIKS